MFNVGFTELLVLGVIGLLVLGPEQLPHVARKLARILNDLKRAKDEIMSPVEDLKSEARNMLERAREQARQLELDEMLKKSMEPDQSPSHKPGPEQVTSMPNQQDSKPEAAPTENAAPVTPIGTPKKDV